MVDPTPLMVEYVEGVVETGVLVSADWLGHTAGAPGVIVDHDGGYTTTYGTRMDRSEFTLHVYETSRDAASALAYRVRDGVLVVLPGSELSGYMVADVEELSMPFPMPDEGSNEWRFILRFAVYIYQL